MELFVRTSLKLHLGVLSAVSESGFRFTSKAINYLINLCCIITFRHIRMAGTSIVPERETQRPHFLFLPLHLLLSWTSLIAQLVKNLPVMQETPVWFLGRKIPWRRDRLPSPIFLCFPCGSAGKESTCNAGDLGSIPGLGRCPGDGKGYPLQYSGLENSMDCIVHGIAESDTTELLSLSPLPITVIFCSGRLQLSWIILVNHGGVLEWPGVLIFL